MGHNEFGNHNFGYHNFSHKFCLVFYNTRPFHYSIVLTILGEPRTRARWVIQRVTNINGYSDTRKIFISARVLLGCEPISIYNTDIDSDYISILCCIVTMGYTFGIIDIIGDEGGGYLRTPGFNVDKQ